MRYLTSNPIEMKMYLLPCPQLTSDNNLDPDCDWLSTNAAFVALVSGGYISKQCQLACVYRLVAPQTGTQTQTPSRSSKSGARKQTERAESEGLMRNLWASTFSLKRDPGIPKNLDSRPAPTSSSGWLGICNA